MNVSDIDAADLRTRADIDPAAEGRAAALHPQFRSRWSPRTLSGATARTGSALAAQAAA